MYTWPVKSWMAELPFSIFGNILRSRFIAESTPKKIIEAFKVAQAFKFRKPIGLSAFICIIQNNIRSITIELGRRWGNPITSTYHTQKKNEYDAIYQAYILYFFKHNPNE